MCQALPAVLGHGQAGSSRIELLDVRSVAPPLLYRASPLKGRRRRAVDSAHRVLAVVSAGRADQRAWRAAGNAGARGAMNGAALHWFPGIHPVRPRTQAGQ
jgi:hypothetical protein